MIDKQEMLKRLCISYLGLRDKLVNSADDWISSNGEFIWFSMIGCLSRLMILKINQGDFENTERLFKCIDELMEVGDEDVVALITTGFLESLLNSRKLDESLWRPLVGPNAEKFCSSIDGHYERGSGK